MRALLCLTLLSVAGPAMAEPVTAIIFRGNARTTEGGQQAYEEWQKAEKAFRAIADPREGYPRIVESASIPGLKPGFHPVILGFCRPDKAEQLLGLYKAVDAEVYGRSVEGPEEACPSLDPSLSVTASTAKLGDKRTLTTLTIVEGQGDHVGLWNVVAAVLRDHTGKVLDVQVVGTREGAALECYKMKARRLDATRVRVQGLCEMNNKGCVPEDVTEVTWTVAAGPTQLAVERRERVVERRECGE